MRPGALQQPDRSERGEQEAKGALMSGNAVANLLDPDRLHAFRQFDLRFVKELLARDDGFQARLRGRRTERGASSGEVEVDRRAAGDRRGQVDKHRADTRRQEDANVFLSLPSRFQRSTERQRAGEGREIGNLGRVTSASAKRNGCIRTRRMNS